MYFFPQAEYLLKNKRGKCGSPIAKIMDNECLSKKSSGTVFTARSPYVKRVDLILQRLIQSGITQKWHSIYFSKSEGETISDSSCHNKTGESGQVLRQFFLNIFEHSISILAFFIELFLVWRLKRNTLQ